MIIDALLAMLLEKVGEPVGLRCGRLRFLFAPQFVKHACQHPMQSTALVRIARGQQRFEIRKRLVRLPGLRVGDAHLHLRPGVVRAVEANRRSESGRRGSSASACRAAPFD